MPAYALFELVLRPDPTDEDLRAYETYRAAVPALIERHGGRYLARGWTGEALEGGPAGDRYHLVEFPDADAARTFWTCPDYLGIKDLRGGAVEVRAILLAPGSVPPPGGTAGPS
jgi:uncharacterized protein (DUF1330 family)